MSLGQTLPSLQFSAHHQRRTDMIAHAVAFTRARARYMPACQWFPAFTTSPPLCWDATGYGLARAGIEHLFSTLSLGGRSPVPTRMRLDYRLMPALCCWSGYHVLLMVPCLYTTPDIPPPALPPHCAIYPRHTPLPAAHTDLIRYLYAPANLHFSIRAHMRAALSR